jgi:DNA-binding response OmpR family regulator
MANLLIVDDEQALLSALQTLFVAAGHDVRVASSGQDALDFFQDEPPDLVIADVLMPGMSGLEFLEIVRDHSKWASIPFLFISAQTSKTLKDQVEALDSTTLMHKPFEVEDLLEAVNQTLEAYT